MKIHSALAFALTIAGAEALALSMFVDARPLLAQASWLGHAGDALAIAVVAFVAVLLISGEKLAAALQERANSKARRFLPRVIFALLHVPLFFALLVLTIAIFTRVDDPPVPLFLAAWPVLAISTGATLLLTVLSKCDVVALFRAGGRSFAFGGLAGFAAWAFASSATLWWEHLSRATMMFAVRLLWLFPGKAQLSFEDLTLSARGFKVIIAKECSGYEGIGLMLALITLHLVAHRKELRFPRALILIPVAITGAFVANILRVTVLVLIGAWISPELATEGFHSKLGWILFSTLSLLLVWLSRRDIAVSERPQRQEIELEPHLVPLLALIATALCTGLFAFSGGIDLLYPLRIIAGAIALYVYRTRYREKLEFSLEAVFIGVVTFGVWMSFDRALPAAPQAPPLWWALCKSIGMIAVIPLVEELAFRGYLMRKLPTFGIFLSSLAFGAVHERFIVATISGFLFAYAASRRGRTSDAVVAHVTTNLCVAVTALLFERWSLLYF